MHAFGIGHPFNLVKTFRLGYEMFDCALPTRDARHGRLCALARKTTTHLSGETWIAYVYIQDKKYIKADQWYL
jgi:queuine tRNA-ribosyltransferase